MTDELDSLLEEASADIEFSASDEPELQELEALLEDQPSTSNEAVPSPAAGPDPESAVPPILAVEEGLPNVPSTQLLLYNLRYQVSPPANCIASISSLLSRN